jgi:hypothetical protein
MKKLLLLLMIVPILGFSQVAVLVVGPQEDGTQDAIYEMKKIGVYLKSQGVHLKTFYGNNANWNEIRKAANGASFFIYSGHGGSLGENGNAGGLFLTNSVSSQDIVNDLHLKRNSVVIFKSVCNGAGSSAGDDGDIGINEATKRVTYYSKPFFEIGAACYYANNLGDGCLYFLKYFFEGKTIKECFINSTQSWWTQTSTRNGVTTEEKVLGEDPQADIEFEKSYKYNRKMNISIASTNWGGSSTLTTYRNGVKTVKQVPSSKGYSIAYVSDPNFSIKKLK